MIALLLGVAGLRAAESPALVRCLKAYTVQSASFAAAPTNDLLGWQLARACFDLADIATNNTQRAGAAQEGITAARSVIGRAPGLAPAHYYLALNLGQLARTRGLSALKLVSEMEAELKTALRLDARFDHAGPDRSLGVVYRDAPGWPLSVGSKGKAREHLRQATALFPNYPENRLYLIESYLKWGDRKSALLELKAAAELFPAARQQLAGPEWAESWADWDRWWKALQAQAAEPPKAGLPPRDAR